MAFTGLSGPEGIAAYPSFSGDPFVAVADTGHNRVVEFGGQESVPTTIVPPVLPLGIRQLAIAAGAAFDPYGTLYFADNFTIYGVIPDATTVYRTVLGFNPTSLAFAVAADAQGNVHLDDLDGAGNIIIKELPHLHPPAILPVNVPIAVRSVASDAAGRSPPPRGGPVAKMIAGTTTPIVLPFTAVTSPTAVAIDSHGDVFAADTPVVGGGAALGAHIYMRPIAFRSDCEPPILRSCVGGSCEVTLSHVSRLSWPRSLCPATTWFCGECSA